MRVAVLTSTEIRHRHFVRRVAKHFEVTAVVLEETGYSPARADNCDLSTQEKAIFERHYADRAREESLMAMPAPGGVEYTSNAATLRVDKSRLNSEQTRRFLDAANVDVVLVYGTDLIRAPLLDAFAGRMINMHLGLSPYYRGTATNFYPLLNDEPEYVGATIHLIDAGIDSGAILAHARPEIVGEDRPHSIGCKAINAGIDVLIQVLPRWAAGVRKPIPQWSAPGSKLYLRKHFHPRQVVALHRKMEDGLIRKYVACAKDVAGRVRLIE